MRLILATISTFLTICPIISCKTTSNNSETKVSHKATQKGRVLRVTLETDDLTFIIDKKSRKLLQNSDYEGYIELDVTGTPTDPKGNKFDPISIHVKYFTMYTCFRGELRNHVKNRKKDKLQGPAFSDDPRKACDFGTLGPQFKVRNEKEKRIVYALNEGSVLGTVEAKSGTIKPVKEIFAEVEVFYTDTSTFGGFIGRSYEIDKTNDLDVYFYNIPLDINHKITEDPEREQMNILGRR